MEVAMNIVDNRTIMPVLVDSLKVGELFEYSQRIMMRTNSADTYILLDTGNLVVREGLRDELVLKIRADLVLF